MVQKVEIDTIDTRYESYRLKNPSYERFLLGSVHEKGIYEPLYGTTIDSDTMILLDGFKRYRCCRTLGISIVPFESLGEDETDAIIQLLRLSNSRSLNILEQAKLVDELKNKHLSVSEIAQKLDRSKAWVSIRFGMLKEMTDAVKDNIFSGKFPVRSYMYTLRSFTRVNKIPKQEVGEFVEAVSGKSLSTRDIDLLAHAYFKGSKQYAHEIKKGNITWILKNLKESHENPEINECERSFINQLDILLKYIKRVRFSIDDSGLNSPSFYAEAELLLGGILKNIDEFKQVIGEFHDRIRKTYGDLSSAQRGNEHQKDSPSTGSLSKNSTENNQERRESTR